MSLADELIKLEQLRERGALSAVEFDQAKARLLNAVPEATTPGRFVESVNRLRRCRQGRWVAGVCAGLASVTGVEPWIWRLVMVALAFAGGLGVVIYALLWFFLPAD